jgi:hypothetical protein
MRDRHRVLEEREGWIPEPPGSGVAPATIATRSPSRCFTTEETGVVRGVDLVAGTLTGRLSAFSSGGMASSLGVMGRELITCAANQIEILSLDTGQVERIERECHGVTADGRYIWVNALFTRALFEYEGLDALREHRPRRRLVSPFASRLGVGDGRLLAAWHSDHKVSAIDLATGSTVELALPGYDGWINGIAELAGKRYVVAGSDDRGIRVHDGVSGALTATLFPGVSLDGLVCTP